VREAAEEISPTSDTGIGLSAPTPPRSQRFRLNEAHLDYARSSRQALAASFGENATAPEKLLLDLVAAEVPLHMALVQTEVDLAARMQALLINNDIKGISVLAKALKNVSAVAGAVGRRIENTLASAVALKAQRRLLELHQGRG
jgi:hypothetical protein